MGVTHKTDQFHSINKIYMTHTEFKLEAMWIGFANAISITLAEKLSVSPDDILTDHYEAEAAFISAINSMKTTKKPASHTNQTVMFDKFSQYKAYVNYNEYLDLIDVAHSLLLDHISKNRVLSSDMLLSLQTKKQVYISSSAEKFQMKFLDDRKDSKTLTFDNLGYKNKIFLDCSSKLSTRPVDVFFNISLENHMCPDFSFMPLNISLICAFFQVRTNSKNFSLNDLILLEEFKLNVCVYRFWKLLGGLSSN